MKWFSFLIIVVGSLFCLMFSNAVAETVKSTEIISISHVKESGDIENITFVLAAAVEPRSFLLKGDKPRLVLDFANCHYKGKNSIILADGVLSTSIRSGIHNKPVVKTRIVIDLSKDFPVNYSQQFEASSNTLTVKLERQASSENSKNANSVLEDTKQTVRQEELEARPLDKKPIPPVFSPKDENTKTDTKEVEKVAVSETAVQLDTAVQAKHDDQTAVAAATKEDGNKVVDKVVPAQKKAETVAAEVKPPPEITDSKNKEREVVPPVSAPVLRGLSFDDSSNRGEMVLFHLNDFFPPTVSAIEKDTPRVLCDFNNMRLGKDVQTPLVANGKYVERIRAANHKNPDKVRVVLDLAPDRDYDLQQVFFKNDNLFVLIVNELPAEKEKSKN